MYFKQHKHGLDVTCKDIIPKTLGNDCLGLFHFYCQFKELLLEKNAAQVTLLVLNDCCHKAKLFLGHRLRVVNQQISINAMQRAIEEECSNNEGTDIAINIIDFKMKQEPI